MDDDRLKQFNFDDISGSKDDKYLVYGIWVIKISESFVHPGGTKLLEKFKPPIDCSMYFDTTRNGQGHTEKARNIMKSFIVGYIGNEKPKIEIGSLPKASTTTCLSKIQNMILFLFFIIFHLIIFYFATATAAAAK